MLALLGDAGTRNCGFGAGMAIAVEEGVKGVWGVSGWEPAAIVLEDSVLSTEDWETPDLSESCRKVTGRSEDLEDWEGTLSPAVCECRRLGRDAP